MEIQSATLGETHPAMATPLNNWGELARGKSMDKEAEEAFRRALPIAEKCLGPTRPLVATILVQGPMKSP